MRKFISYYKPYKRLFTANIIAALITAALALILPLCVRHITNNILISGAPDILPRILQTGALMIAVIVIQTCTATFNDWMGHVMGAKIERDLRMELFSHYQKLSFRFYDNNKTGELMSRLTNDLHGIAEVSHHVPILIVTYLIQLTGSIIILLYLNWKLALLILLVILIIIVYAFVFYKKLQISYKINQERIANVNTAAQENLSGIRIVKTFANEDAEINKFAKENNSFYESRIGIYKSEAFLFTLVDSFFTPLITILIVVMGGIWIADGSLEIASLLVFIMYAAYLTAPIPQLAGVIPFYQSGIAGFVRFKEIMETEPDIKDKENATELTVKNGSVQFKDVAFGYNEGHEYVLNNINLEVTSGQTVAIVGRSGIGKTTLCALIPRLYELNAGAIYIDGECITDVTLHSLRKQIGVVRQETFLFAGTVMENILYGRVGATKEEAVEAAKKANAHNFIINLPNGYETDIGQSGVKLSGGQQQRLSIARVFLKNPPILIFDEATSSLDMESEKAVLESLNELAKGRTTFVIAHRLSTVRNADRIIVLTDDGISEQGSHEELIDRGGVYFKLFNAYDLER